MTTKQAPDDLTHYMEATSRLKQENDRYREALVEIARRAQGSVFLMTYYEIAQRALDGR